MKVLVLICCMLFSLICFANNDEFEPYFFRNHFYDEIHEEGMYFYSLFSIGDRSGDSSDIAFKNLDTNLYKGKNLGFILDDLSNKYIFLQGMAFNGVPALDQIDFSYRTHFTFSFKYNDTLSLGVAGKLAKSERFYEESDSVAFSRLLEIDKYILLPTLHNMKISYRKIVERMKENSNPRLENTLEELLRDFPEVAK
jgi:hypothetical protein